MATHSFRPLLRILLGVFVGLFAVIGLSVVVFFVSTILTRPRPAPGFLDHPEAPQSIDPGRFSLVSVGMPEAQVLEILGLPFESRGPQTTPLPVPDVLNPEECEGKIPCTCEGPVKELFYYRGSAGSSFFVYIDAVGTVCCYRHTQTLRMSSGNVW